jgi:N-acetylmuramoyl-L-alanine amidase
VRFYYFFAFAVFTLLPSYAHEGAEPRYIRHASTHQVRKVVIDAGHGGKDSGSLGTKGKEKDITLKIALLVGQYIEDNLPDVKVIYTRKTDDFLTLQDRAQLANVKDADVFISIHCNSLPKRTTRIKGSETYVMGLHTAEENLAVAKRENEVILLEDNYLQRYGGYDPNSPEAHIMLSMYQNAFLAQSIMLAEKVEDQFKQRTNRPSRGVKQAGFVVLRATAMPSILIETGFLSHPEDEQYLLSSKGQAYIASSIYRAFRDYKNVVENNPRAAQEHAKASIPSRPQGNMPTPTPKPNPTPTPERPTPVPGQPKATVAQGLRYRVQLASSPTALNLNEGRWKGVQGVEVEQQGKSYKYLFGNYADRQDALKAQRIVQERGFKDAFIVIYKDGKRQ